MNGLILRTCDNISKKCWFDNNNLILKSFFLRNTLSYALLNNYKIFVICDSVSKEYQSLIELIFADNAKLFFYQGLGNYGSFQKQIEIALEYNFDFVEFAEDDFLKKGLIDFQSLDKEIVYTGYHHPSYDKLQWRSFERVTDNLYSTVCSFLLHRQLLQIYHLEFMKFRDSSDSEMWYEMTAPLWLKVLLKIKALLHLRFLKISFKKGNLRLRRLGSNVSWIHCAKDSLPFFYKDLIQYSKIEDVVKRYNF